MTYNFRLNQIKSIFFVYIFIRVGLCLHTTFIVAVGADPNLYMVHSIYPLLVQGLMFKLNLKELELLIACKVRLQSYKMLLHYPKDLVFSVTTDIKRGSRDSGQSAVLDI